MTANRVAILNEIIELQNDAIEEAMLRTFNSGNSMITGRYIVPKRYRKRVAEGKISAYSNAIRSIYNDDIYVIILNKLKDASENLEFTARKSKKFWLFGAIEAYGEVLQLLGETPTIKSITVEVKK